MADNDIAQAWASFDDNRRSALLAKMTPEQKSNLRVALQNQGHTVATAPIAQAPAPEKPGFISRTLQGLGLPSSKEELSNILPNKESVTRDLNDPGIASATAVAGPIGYVGAKMVKAYVSTLAKTGKEAGREIKDSASNIASGGPVIPNLGKAALGLTDFQLRGLLSPIGGASVMAWGEDVGTKNYAGAAGDATAVLINALTLKSALPMGKSGKLAKLTYAADLKSGVEDLKTVLPDIEKATAGAPPKTLGEMVNAVNAAKDQMNMESGLAMQKIKGQSLVPIDISNRIRSRISPDMIQTSEGRTVANMYGKAATDFQKPWTFEQLDALRQRWFPDTKAYRTASPADRAMLLKADPRLAIKVDVVDAIRDTVYPAMDRAAGQPQGYFASLKGRQSTLINLQKNLDKQIDVLATETQNIKGAPRFTTSNVSAYAAGSKGAHPGISLHRLNPLKPNPLEQANTAIARGFSGRPTSKAILYSYPLRQVLSGQPAETKKPGEQLKDLQAIQNRSSNPAMPIGAPE